MTNVIAEFYDGLDVSLKYEITDVGAGTTPVDGLLGTASQGFIVPAGFKFVPIAITAEYNAARTAGTSTVKVTDALVEVANGPEALIDGTNTLTHQGVVSSVGSVSIAAGQEVGVSATGDGSFAPTTADAEIVLFGKLLPV